jgi:hypothetical protein
MEPQTALHTILNTELLNTELLYTLVHLLRKSYQFAYSPYQERLQCF